MSIKLRKILVFSALMLGILSMASLAIRGSLVPRSVPEIESYEPWDKELVEFVADMPVQEGGRLKPFSTWAAFRMYGIHSKRKIKVKVQGKTLEITPTEWMLDCIFRPKVAHTLPSFRIEDAQVATALKIKTGEFTDSIGKKTIKKRRDLYSFNEIVNDDFISQWQQYSLKQATEAKTARVPKGIDLHKSNLLASISDYHRQTRWLEMTEAVHAGMQKVLEESEKTQQQMSAEMLESMPKFFAMKQLEHWLTQSFSQDQKIAEQARQQWQDFLVVDLAMLPSENAKDSKWISYPAEMKHKFLNQETTEKDQRRLAEATKDWLRWIELKSLYEKGDQQALLQGFKQYRENVETILKKRGENLEKVNSEITYYNRNYYAYAFGFYFLGCLLMIFLLPSPQSLYGTVLGYASLAFALLATGYVLSGVVHRSLIMGRYPLGNLYDTILLITGVAVLVLLFMEIFSRKKVCVAAAVTLGLFGMFLANRFEVGDGADNMKPLAAVLNSNYWLATHVTTISIGYAGGLIAAMLSTFYLMARLTGIDNKDKNFRRLMTRMAYGAACFTLFFSLVGTVLGGVWANDSWGRFWGWDPKENGALMIVLWYLAILHARLAGYVKEWGLHIVMVLGANVVAFSWWGVNFLATGLHNYGFASGGEGEKWLNIYYLLNIGIAVVAFGFAWYEKEAKKLKNQTNREKKVQGSEE